MSDSPRNHLSDIRGTGRLAVDAIAGVSGLVEDLHTTIAARPLLGDGQCCGIVRYDAQTSTARARSASRARARIMQIFCECQRAERS